MANIIHRIGIKAPVSKVYAAFATIDGIKGWWTSNTVGVSKPGGRITFTFENPDGSKKGAFTMEVTQLEADRAVRWEVKDGPADWIGTSMTFDLTVDDKAGMSLLVFGHRDWREENGHMAHCSMKWATFLLSLRDYVEKGEGRPSPRDLKIDNWN